MSIKNIYQPYEIEFLATENYSAPELKKTFFEMVFILEGQGIQEINHHQLPYAPNKLFLIFPEDHHSFQVKRFTKFFFIRFNEDYLKMQNPEWVHKIEYLFFTHNHLPGCILKTVTDKPLVRAIVEALNRESQNSYPNKTEITTQLINTLITIAARNMAYLGEQLLKNLSQPAVVIQDYIHQHIYDPEALKLRALADHLNISLNYVGEYCQKHLGESLMSYIAKYRLKLIENRLKSTDMRIAEIAEELGFTDTSHLNRFVQKYTGKNPSILRNILQSD